MGFFSKDKDEKGGGVLNSLSPTSNTINDVQEGVLADNADNLQRHLDNRQIQLIAIGGSIGTALFISIGSGLYHGGPGSLFIAYTLQSLVLAMVNNCIAEMSTAYPVSGGFIRLAGKFVDDALGFMVGWNFLCVVSLFSVLLPRVSPHSPSSPHATTTTCMFRTLQSSPLSSPYFTAPFRPHSVLNVHADNVIGIVSTRPS